MSQGGPLGSGKGGGDGGFNWVAVTSASPTNPIQIVRNTGYICNGVSQVTFTLPLTGALGDSFIVFSNTATFQIAENGAQVIQIGTGSSTAGAGTATSNSAGDSLELTYIGGNVFAAVTPPQGTITLA
jgi:hypothetical protein